MAVGQCNACGTCRTGYASGVTWSRTLQAATGGDRRSGPWGAPPGVRRVAVKMCEADQGQGLGVVRRRFGDILRRWGAGLSAFGGPGKAERVKRLCENEFRQAGFEELPAKCFHLVTAIVIAIGVAGIGHIREAAFHDRAMGSVENCGIFSCGPSNAEEDTHDGIDIVQQPGTWAVEPP